MDHAGVEGMWQVIGMSSAIVPMLVLGVWLAIASRRREAAERAEPPTEI